MIESLQASFDLIRELFFDGFLALMAVAVAAPLLGVLLVLRRMPILGLAIPQLAGCGQAGTYFFFALFAVTDPAHPEEPGTALQMAGSLAAVALGMLALVGLARDRRYLGVQACIAFLAAVALRELFYIGSPYHKIFEESIHHGRLLTVDMVGRYQVIGACTAATVLSALLWRRMWVSAFDPDQARLLGVSPDRNLLITLLLLGGTSVLCVPVVGPEVVLTLMLVPPAVLRGTTPSLASYPLLSVLAGILGSAGAFLLACTEGVDWPPGPAVVVCVIVSSACIALLARLLARRRP